MFMHCKCKCGVDDHFHNASSSPMDDMVFMSHDAFHSLSEEERNRVFGDIYGVGANVIEETPEFIEDKIRQVIRAMDKIPKSKKLGYLMALDEEDKQGTHFVRSTKLLLMFLRAARFHVPSTAKRIAKHFDHKLELFDVSLLPHSITQDNLSDDDKEVLHSGFLYTNHNMDHFGRTVMFLNFAGMTFKHVNNFFRVVFYNSFAALEDNEHGQKLGVVVIMYTLENVATEKQQKEIINKLKESPFLGSAPYRIASFHLCEHTQTNFNICKQILLTLYSISIKARYRIHNGSHKELRSKLLKFGIRVELLPVLNNGEFDEYTFMQPLKKQLQQECHRRGSTNSATDEGGTSCDDYSDDMSLGSY